MPKEDVTKDLTKGKAAKAAAAAKGKDKDGGESSAVDNTKLEERPRTLRLGGPHVEWVLADLRGDTDYQEITLRAVNRHGKQRDHALRAANRHAAPCAFPRAPAAARLPRHNEARGGR